MNIWRVWIVFKNVDIYESGAGNGRGTDQLTFFNRGQIIPQYYYWPQDFGLSAATDASSVPALIQFQLFSPCIFVYKIFLDTLCGENSTDFAIVCGAKYVWRGKILEWKLLIC